MRKTAALLIMTAGQLVTTAGPASAVEPVTVLGLPLGGKLQAPMRKCKDAPPKMDAPLCWIYSRIGSAGTVSGALHVPGEDARPKWAAYAAFEGNIAKDGTLQQFTVESSNNYPFEQIVDSISARFGPPKSSKPSASYRSYASWDRPEIGIRILCELSGKCYTKFLSAEVAADERRRIHEVVKRNAARPIMP